MQALDCREGWSKIFLSQLHKALLHIMCNVWSCFVMNKQNSAPKHATCLFYIVQCIFLSVSQQRAMLPVYPHDMKSTNKMPCQFQNTVHTNLSHVISGLAFLCWHWCVLPFQVLELFDTPKSHFQWWSNLKKVSYSLLYYVRKSRTLPVFQFLLLCQIMRYPLNTFFEI